MSQNFIEECTKYKELNLNHSTLNKRCIYYLIFQSHKSILILILINLIALFLFHLCIDARRCYIWMKMPNVKKLIKI